MKSIIGFATNLFDHPDLPNIFNYAWLEGSSEAKIAFLSEVSDWNQLGKWPAGRLFGESGEYRWQRNTVQTEGKIHAVLILDDDGDLPEIFEGRLEIVKEGSVAPLILWGEWVDPEKDSKCNPHGGPVFYAREIPVAQNYPIPIEQAKEKDKTPCLIVQKYRHKQNESEDFKGEFIRCVNVHMQSNSKEEVDA